MTHATLPISRGSHGPVTRVAVAALAAVALISGALNLRPEIDHLTGAAGASDLSAVDALVGVDHRADTSLDAQIRSLQDTLRSGDARVQGPAASMLGQLYLQKVRETGDPSYYPK